MNIASRLPVVILLATCASAQVAAPNDKGVSLGNIHLNVHDMDVQKQFWAQLGGAVGQKLVRFPGVYLVLRQQEPTGGSPGSVINHFGFRVKNLDDWKPKWTAAGLKIQLNKNPAVRQLFLYSTDDVKIEMTEDPSISNPIEMHHIHLFVPDQAAAQAWYVKTFGAVPAKRSAPNGEFYTATIPGVEFTFTKSDPQAASRGRSVDDIGIEVKNLDPFVKGLIAAGVDIEHPIRPGASDPHMMVTHITDPWGTRFELTEGFPGSLTWDGTGQLLANLLHIAPFTAGSPGN
jgi:catechol 2,3-dioxygenase-like lactoylglutathione lyase family enzyme